MPYIESENRRENIRNSALENVGAWCDSAGDLNFAITEMIESYRANHGTSYKIFNHITGALDDAKDEFRRRVVHPYEDAKCLANGDVYASLEGA